MITRLFAILMLITAGLPRLGLGSTGCQGQCCETACHPTVVQVSCCGSDSGDDGFCPMSNGPCECVKTPAPGPEPKPEAPLPRPDRDIVVGLTNDPPRVHSFTSAEGQRARGTSLVLSLAVGKSSNEIQARLGIWRT